MTFTDSIRRRLETYRDRTFMNADFLDIATEFGKDIKAVTSALRGIEEKGLIHAVGARGTHRGGTPSKVYEVVSGAVIIAPKNARYNYQQNWKAGIVEREKMFMVCADRLQNVLDGITRARA